MVNSRKISRRPFGISIPIMADIRLKLKQPQILLNK